MSSCSEENLLMTPESDPAAAFTVTRNTNTTISGQAGVTLSQTPSANVSLGLSRSSQLTVSYAVNTWSVSAHRVANGMSSRVIQLTFNMIVDAYLPAPSLGKDIMLRPKGKIEYLKTKIGKESSNSTQSLSESCHASESFGSPRERHPRYQWFWAGTQKATETLTPDLKHTVKRHIVVKRIIAVEDFPVSVIEAAREVLRAEEDEMIFPKVVLFLNERARRVAHEATKDLKERAKEKVRQITSAEWREGERLLTFNFCVQVRYMSL